MTFPITFQHMRMLDNTQIWAISLVSLWTLGDDSGETQDFNARHLLRVTVS